MNSNIRKLTRAATMLVLMLPVLAEGGTWNIDPAHSNVQFKVRHLMVSNVKGTFADVAGVVSLDERKVENSSVNVTIKTDSINTGVAERDVHLKSSDFFEVAKYPVMTFVSKKVTRTGKDKLKVAGELTLHGITRPVVLDVEGPTPEMRDPWGNTRRGASASARINRKDFGLAWNKALETGGVVVGDEVSISIEVELVKAQVSK